MRRFEIANLDIRDIDFQKRLIQIPKGKGGKSRTIPVSEDLLGDLKHLIGSRKTGPVFPGRGGKSLSLRQINKVVGKAGELAGIPHPNRKYKNLTCHLFRHSFAREWKKRGGSIESLSKILGHTSVKTTLDEYGTESLEVVQENYAKLVQDMF
jgi:integrase